jgi:molecular chaperone GrpE
LPEKTEDALPSDEDSQPVNGGDRENGATGLLAEKERQIQELTDTLKRTQAEFENYKKRMERDWSERTKLAGERIVADLLAVLDTFDKAEESAVKAGDAAVQSDGLRSIRMQLLQTLQRAGLREIDTRAPFDPFMHEALMREELEEGEDGTILEVFQKGYMMGPKVIRTAKVKVSARRRSDEGEPGGADAAPTQYHDQHEGDE